MVDTKIAASSENWNSPPKLAIARALIDSSRPLTSGELARLTRRNQSNVKRQADQLAAEGLLIRNVPPSGKRGAGRRPQVAYSLADAERVAVRALLAENSKPGVLRNGQQLVFATVDGPQLLDVLETLAQPQSTQADWAVAVDGSHQGRLVVFDGKDALAGAEGLMAALTALEVDCHRWSVAEVVTGQEMAASARKGVESAAQAVKGRADRQAPW